MKLTGNMVVDADLCKKSSERHLMKETKNGGEAAKAVPNDEYGVIKFTKKSKKNSIIVNLVAQTMNLKPWTSEFL